MIYLGLTRMTKLWCVTLTRYCIPLQKYWHVISTFPKALMTQSLYGNFRAAKVQRVFSGRDDRTVKFFSPSSVLTKIESYPALIHKIFENYRSDPVLNRQCNIICFYFALWDKITTGAILPLAWRKNSSSSAFASWGKIDTAFWHFQNLTRKCLFGIGGKSTVAVILP